MNADDDSALDDFGLGLLGYVGLALALWGVDALFVIRTSAGHACIGEMCGLSLLGPALLLGGLTVLVSAIAGLITMVDAVRRRDVISAVATALILLVGALALAVLWLNGQPGHSLLTALYGVDPDGVGQHPFAFYGSVALVCAPPLAALAAYHLARRGGSTERTGVLAVLLATLAVQVVIRLSL